MYLMWLVVYVIDFCLRFLKILLSIVCHLGLLLRTVLVIVLLLLILLGLCSRRRRRVCRRGVSRLWCRLCVSRSVQNLVWCICLLGRVVPNLETALYPFSFNTQRLKVQVIRNYVFCCSVFYKGSD